MKGAIFWVLVGGIAVGGGLAMLAEHIDNEKAFEAARQDSIAAFEDFQKHAESTVAERYEFGDRYVVRLDGAETVYLRVTKEAFQELPEGAKVADLLGKLLPQPAED